MRQRIYIADVCIVRIFKISVKSVLNTYFVQGEQKFGARLWNNEKVDFALHSVSKVKDKFFVKTNKKMLCGYIFQNYLFYYCFVVVYYQILRILAVVRATLFTEKFSDERLLK